MCGPFPGNKMALIWFLSPPNLSMSSKMIIPCLKSPKKCLWTHYISKKWLYEQFEWGWMGQNCTVFKIWLLFGPFPGNKMCLKTNISLEINRYALKSPKKCPQTYHISKKWPNEPSEFSAKFQLTGNCWERPKFTIYQ